MEKYTKLALEGGGVRGIAYVGALMELEKQDGFLDRINGVAGTSAGSIIALLLALRMNPNEMNQIMWELSFPDFSKKWSGIGEMFDRYGLHPGDFALELFERIVKGEAPKNPNASTTESKRIAFPDNEGATFEDLQAAGGRDLRVFAGNLNTRKLQEFSYRKTPKVSLARAVRASMSIPVFFDAYQMQVNGEISTFVDGGTLYNYPFTAFDDTADETLGLYFTSETKRTDLPWGDPIRYFKDLVGTLMEGRYVYFETDEMMKANTIEINPMGIKATDFGISDAQKKTLEREGMDAVKRFVNGSADV